MIYRPSANEITTIIEQGIAKHPSLTDRYRRAAELLHNDALETINGYWLCASQSGNSAPYSVNGTCDCPDYQRQNASLHGHIFCKHKLALEAYRRILEGHLARRFIGNTKFRHEAARSRLHPNTYLLQLWDTNQLGTHQAHGQLPVTVCTFHWAKRGRALNDQALAHFAEWLATANPILTLDPMAIDANHMDYQAWRQHWFVDENA
jgi:hypothetical protein